MAATERATAQTKSTPSKVRHGTVGWIVGASVASFPMLLLAAVTVRFLLDSLLAPAQLEFFRVGNLALTDETKTADAAFPVVFFASLVILILVLTRAFRQSPPSSKLKAFLLLELLMASPVLVQSILGIGRPLLEIVDSPYLVTVALQLPPAIFLLATWLLSRRSQASSSSERREDPFLPLLVLSATAGFASLGAVTAIRFVAAPAVIPIPVTTGLWVLIGLGFVALVIWASRSTRISDRASIAVGFGVSGIMALPLLVPPLILQNGFMISTPGANSGLWKLVVAVLATLILSETAIRYARRVRPGLWATIPSISVAALLVPLRAVYALPSVPSDDYHFGETFAPFALLHNSGQLPYVDIYLPRGILLNLVPGFVNAVLNDGSAAALALGTTVIALVVVAAAHLLLRYAVGFPLATAAVALIAISNSYVEGDLLTVAIMIALLVFILRRPNPVLLGIVIVGANAFSILAYPMMGIVSTGLTGAVLIAGSVGSLLARSHRDLRYGIIVFGVSIVTAAIVALSPAGQFLSAAISYVTSNGSSNTESFGVALTRTWMTPFSIGQIFAFAFVLGIAASVWLLWTRRRLFRAPSWNRYIFLGIAIVPAAFAIGLTGRYMGRIDPDAWSFRPAAGTLVVLGLLVPAVIWIVGNRRARTLAMYSLSIAACISITVLPLNQGGLVRSSLGMLEAPSSWESGTYTASAPRLGVGQGNADQMSAVSDLASVSQNLPFGESILNLSNRGALFGYLSWENPLPYLAPYNIESSEAEAESIARLKQESPTYALIGPGPQWDGVSLSLRNAELSKWVMENYTPFECGSSIWATLGVAGDASTGLLDCPTPATGSTVQSVEALWTTFVGAPVDLDMVPAAWGARSASMMSTTSLSVSSTIRAVGATTQVFELSTDRRAVEDGELLILTVQCGSDASADSPSMTSVGDSRASLQWTDEGAVPEGLSRFEWGTGRFVVPLDAYPSWLLDSEHPTTLHLTAPVSDCDGGWDVSGSIMPRP
ncbi:hypothetical protein E3O06_07100 [Cryobacterium glaciale]|uniref:Uncharacterized protein n=1 Tax=Cryobacterium glaciale TaxID=1259145 RepID=A0A4R8V111_9MICO|nr:hypothetical protein [Cryobacterium glaciale]TFB74353.1 hypothetical protein E3O06_07100 [Cryobacterium glaciale]